MAAKSTSRTRWREKLENEDHSRIVEIPFAMAKRLGPGTMLIAKPLDVDAVIRKTRKGRLITVSEIRERLARDNNTDTTCPLTTGIFVRIAAETAEEDLRSGRKRVTPYWRVVRDDGSLNERFPGGVKAQSRRLKEEGHSILPAQGKRPPRVKDFEKWLTRL
jgi:6-O-methylguanine DNA methyltransferase, DNA binding domain